MGSIALSLGLVIACVFCVDARQVGERLAATDPRWLVGFFSIYMLQVALLGLRWSAISRQAGVPLGWWRASAEYALSVLVNNVLPTGFAGDGWRAFRHSSRCPKHSLPQILEVLALDRASGQVALLMVVLASAPFSVQAGLLDPFWLLVAFLACLALLWMVRRWTAHPVARRPATSMLRAFLGRATALLLDPARAVVHLPISLLLTSSLMLQLWLAARAAGIDLDVRLLCWLGPLIVLATSVPSLFGSWGVREGASALLFASAGLSSSAGVTVSLLFGVFSLVSALPGAAVMLFDAPTGALRIDRAGTSPRRTSRGAHDSGRGDPAL
jgi:glycosyltransferase 2 family protein